MTKYEAFVYYTTMKRKPGGHTYAEQIKTRADQLHHSGETDDMTEAMYLAVAEQCGSKPDFAQ